MSDNRLHEGLNEPQYQAVEHDEGPVLVLAGPGSGKTRVITHRIARLLEKNVRPSRILALTFTNKAADEMKSRIQILAPGKWVWVGTFHKFCASLLREHAPERGLERNYTIYDTDESGALLKQVIAGTRIPPGVTQQGVQTAISWAKNAMILPEDYHAKPGSLLGETVEEVYPKYQEELKRANAVDFDDLLLHVAFLLQKNEELRAKLDERYLYVLIDEYQDTNLVQYAIARSLSRNISNLMVSGDPDQSIYGWRGANIKNILDFEDDFPQAKIIRLEQNYRSTKRILAVADQLIQNNRFRKPKTLFTDNEEGNKVRLVLGEDQQEEAESIAEEIAREIAAGTRKASDYAIFYRMNALSRNLEHALRRHGVPFQLIRGLEFYERKEVKDLIAYLQLVHNPRDTISFSRVVNEPRRGIGKTTLKKISDYGSELGLPMLEAAREFLGGKTAGISAKTKKSLAGFIEMTERLQAAVSEELPVESLIALVLQETKYEDQFRLSESEEDADRLANIQELLSAARDFDAFEHHDNLEDPLQAFLEQTSLSSDIDTWDSETDRVSLMTLHAAKGLEFPVVYIIAVEEGILPHERSSHKEEQEEEERRLLFVGITRAKEELRLSHTIRRGFRGSFNNSISSRFLMELPKDSMWILSEPGSLSESLKQGEDTLRVVYEKGANENCGDSEYFEDYSEEYDDVHVEYGDDGKPICRRPQKRKKDSKPAEKLFSLTTGQELLKKQIAKFEVGTMVRHENHGIGVIDKVGKNKVRISFFSEAGTLDLEIADPKLSLIPGRTR